MRVLCATSLFDGHDASINVMRRVMQSAGAEIIYLGHNRSVQDIVSAAQQEDVDAIAISSYQGGHMEYFSYILDELKRLHLDNIKVFGGGGGVISKSEIAVLEKKGVTKIYSPEDGKILGLQGMIQDLLKRIKPFDRPEPKRNQTNLYQNINDLAVTISWIEKNQKLPKAFLNQPEPSVPVIGITGPGGAGKSTLLDELLLRFTNQQPDIKIAVLCIDPSKRKTGGALLGDRIRMNTLSKSNIFMRSMSTRSSHQSLNPSVQATLQLYKISGFDLIFLESAGIGQSDSRIIDHSNVSLYVMTPEFGAPTQLEKIDMLDYADCVAINKFDRLGAADALKSVQKILQRSKGDFDKPLNEMPVVACTAHTYRDMGTNKLYNLLLHLISQQHQERSYGQALESGFPQNRIGLKRTRYLSDIVHSINSYHSETQQQCKHLAQIQAIEKVLKDTGNTFSESTLSELKTQLEQSQKLLSHQSHTLLKSYQQSKNEQSSFDSLSGLSIPRVCLPELEQSIEQLRYMYEENLPGHFPFTAGVFPLKRKEEDATRMFAGEGSPEQTNKRFHYLSHAQNAIRLSTAFDSVTLYGEDPSKRPDIYGKIGNSGVSIASLDDMKRLFSGFNLISSHTSVSMTINGPAPIILAFYFLTAVDAECERRLVQDGHWNDINKNIEKWFKDRKLTRPSYRENFPKGHDQSGLGFLGVSADMFIDIKEYETIQADVFKALRGTVQADILKEDQAQNTCIFNVRFALELMADVQKFFIQHQIKNFYSVSVSGYHIAEAGANPITQLAFTLANGFTLVEYYLDKGMQIDDICKNISFFFSNGLDPEYAVIGRVARKIWAIAMRDFYRANERSQKLKYHIQTSGRSLHAEEIDFNDIRTTLQALLAISDHCNSLHTNAYDEALTTPTEESVRRALAIQLIINKEYGLTQNENPLQGSYLISWLSEQVEQAVLKEFLSLDARGGVLGAMETLYQRGKIQEESLTYEHKKSNAELPIIGVNTFLHESSKNIKPAERVRSSEDSKNLQIEGNFQLQKRYKNKSKNALKHLKTACEEQKDIFSTLMHAAKYCSLGQMTQVLYEAGGAYRRNM